MDFLTRFFTYFLERAKQREKRGEIEEGGRWRERGRATEREREG